MTVVTNLERVMTYIEEIEAVMEAAKEHLVREFGDHISIHNALTDLRDKVLAAGSRLSPPEELSGGAVQDKEAPREV